MCRNSYLQCIVNHEVVEADFNFQRLRQAMRHHRFRPLIGFLKDSARKLLQADLELTEYESLFLKRLKSRSWRVLALTRTDCANAREDTAARLLYSLFAIIRRLRPRERGLYLSYYLLTIGK